MAFIDYYKIMGIPKDTPQKDIRAAYTKRAKQFHPDLHQDDPKAKAKFQALSEAYAVLSDPEKRKKYDRYGEQWEQAEAFEQAGRGGGGTHFYYGGGDGGGDAFDGFQFGQFGQGGGSFSSFFEDLFGASAGTRKRSYARRDPSQYDANTTVTIDLYTALLGGDIILTLQNGGKLKLRVKPETQNGTKVRLRGKGFQMPDGTFGNLIITYNVKLPTNLNARQRDLLRQMEAAGN